MFAKKVTKFRYTSGTVLGVTLVLASILIFIGIAFFILMRLFSGNSQLTNASDAGILNVAKEALVKPAIALNDTKLFGVGVLPYNDFAVASTSGNYFIADQQVNGYPAIDVLTYNRCAAQAVLVGLQAQTIDNQLARQHAQALAWCLLGIGQRLQDSFINTPLNSFYDDLANRNDLNMLGSAVIAKRQGNVTPAYIDSGRPSNIYFYPDVVDPYTVINLQQPTSALNQIPQNTAAADIKPDQIRAKQNSAYFQPGENVYYTSGYSTIELMPGRAEASLVSFIPNNPQASSHAVDKARCDASLNTPAKGVLPWMPPNAFEAVAQASDNATGNIAKPGSTALNAISCATIGCGSLKGGLPGLSAGNGPGDQPACIPGGFVRVRNLPGMETMSNAPLGPAPGAVGGVNAGTVYDGSNFILNNSALGLAGNFKVYIGVPLIQSPSGSFSPGLATNPDGSVNLNEVIFTDNAAGLKVLKSWIAFNKSQPLSASSSLYNTDIIGGVHRNPQNDPFKGPNTSQFLNANPNASSGPLLEGPTLNQPAYLKDEVNLCGYIEIYSANIDGVTPFTVYDEHGSPIPGASVSAPVGTDALIQAAASNLGQGTLITSSLSIPNANRTVSWIEYLKYYVVDYFMHFNHKGQVSISINQGNYLTGLKNFNYFDKNGQPIHLAVPNTSTHGIPGPPSGFLFMSVASPEQLLNGIDNLVQHYGGYHPGQVSLEAMKGTITNALRLINPRWGRVDVDNALAMADLAPGEVKYLRDDGHGNLILSASCPQDTGVPTETTVLDLGNANRTVFYRTEPGQFLPVQGSLIDTSKNGSSTALTGDANLELQPWRAISGPIYSEEGSIFYRNSGYNNLVGELDFYARPAQDTSITFSNPN